MVIMSHGTVSPVNLLWLKLPDICIDCRIQSNNHNPTQAIIYKPTMSIILETIQCRDDHEVYYGIIGAKFVNIIVYTNEEWKNVCETIGVYSFSCVFFFGNIEFNLNMQDSIFSTMVVSCCCGSRKVFTTCTISST